MNELLTRRRVRGGIVSTVGYLLSPLSWWNDLVVNLPLAYLFATAVAVFVPAWFLPALIVGYWLTNIAGFVLLHLGAVDIVSGEGRTYSRATLLRDLGFSIVYTLLVVVLVWLGWLRFPAAYF